MDTLRVYLDTSVISHLFHHDAPEWKAITTELFDSAIATGIHEAYISGVVIDELGRTRNTQLRGDFFRAIERYALSILPEGGDEVDRLASAYLLSGVVPAKYSEDALHIAYATVFELDVLVTWNFRHLARVRTMDLVATVNANEGYTHPLKLLTPLEVLAP